LDRVPYGLQFHLLIAGQLVLDLNQHFHIQSFYLALTVQHLVELRQRQLLVYRIALHGFMQRFHRISNLPSQLIEPCRRALNHFAQERFLGIGQSQLALMLHDHVRRKHVAFHGILWRPWRARWHLLTIAVHPLRRLWLWLLGRRDQGARQNKRDQDRWNHEDSVTHLISPYRLSARAKTISSG
jgi:hypothetical protein